MRNRHNSIGVKQVIPYEWLQKTASLSLAGLSPKEVRKELHSTIALEGRQIQSGERSAWTRRFLVNNLMTVWSSPSTELRSVRKTALRALREFPDQEPAVQWAMISASYPFWFNTARQTGRLLNLQAQATQAQIVGRLKERYGDRQTISRYARFVIRSFVNWGAIIESKKTGCYEKGKVLTIANQEVTTLLLHASLLAIPERTAPLSGLLGSPAFFPLRLARLSDASVVERAGCLKIVRYGLDEEFVTLTA